MKEKKTLNSDLSLALSECGRPGGGIFPRFSSAAQKELQDTDL